MLPRWKTAYDNGKQIIDSSLGDAGLMNRLPGRTRAPSRRCTGWAGTRRASTSCSSRRPAATTTSSSPMPPRMRARTLAGPPSRATRSWSSRASTPSSACSVRSIGPTRADGSSRRHLRPWHDRAVESAQARRPLAHRSAARGRARRPAADERVPAERHPVRRRFDAGVPRLPARSRRRRGVPAGGGARGRRRPRPGGGRVHAALVPAAVPGELARQERDRHGGGCVR